MAIVPAGKYKRRDAPERPLNPRDAPEDATVADYFWYESPSRFYSWQRYWWKYRFAKIVYINQQTKMFHVQWMEHASKTILQELSDSQELFLNEMCDSIPVEQVVDKAEVHWGPSPSGLNPLGYFCKWVFYYNWFSRKLNDDITRMMYDERDASFTNIEQAPEITNSSPPDNCHCCLKASQRNQDSALAEVEKGFAFRGSTYHIDDYVMIKTPSGPCDIGQIVELTFAKSMRGAATVSVLMLGRISDIIDICPMDIVKDEVRFFDNLDMFLRVNMDRARSGTCTSQISDATSPSTSWSGNVE